MKPILRIAGSIALLIAGTASLRAQQTEPLRAQQTEPLRTQQTEPLRTQQTGLEAMGVLRRTLGPLIADRVVFLSGRRGAEQPVMWRLVARDPAFAGYYREYQVQGGRVISESAVPAAESASYVTAPLVRRTLRVDSPVVFWRADTEAKKALIGFDAVDYELRNAEFSTKPVWVVRLIGPRGAVVGELVVSAETGTVLRRTWFEAGRRTVPRPAPPAQGAAPAAVSGTAQQAWAGTRSGWNQGKKAVQTGFGRASTTVGNWLVRAGAGTTPASPATPTPPPEARGPAPREFAAPESRNR